MGTQTSRNDLASHAPAITPLSGCHFPASWSRGKWPKSSYKDIKIAVGETLSQFARRDNLISWVRPSQEANMPALADEIARLSKENAELRVQIMRSTHPTVLHDPTPTWQDFFDFVRKLAINSEQYHVAVASHSSDRSIHRRAIEDVVDRLKSVLGRLDLDATGTSTEGLLPQARRLVDALIEDPPAAGQIDDFRMLVAKHLRTPNEVKS